MKYVIRLQNKYTGENIHLGSQFNSHEDAELYSESNVCHRCNSASICPVMDDAEWINKEIGFKTTKEKGGLRDESISKKH
jgi:hypothetical protein